MARRDPTFRFALVDVFTDTPFAGKPLAVVPDAQTLDEALLPRMAREFNQVETSFLFSCSREGAGWRLRSFTAAGKEVLERGHNAVGACWWLADSGHLALEESHTHVCLELGEHVLTVIIESSAGRPTAIAMHQGLQRFGLIAGSRKSLALALGLPRAALGPRELPPQVVSTGTPHLLVPVVPSALPRLRPDEERLREILTGVGAKGCYVFAPTPGRRTVATARFINPLVGGPEDPATPSAAAPLACYLRYYGVVDDDHVRIAQGLEIGRPSELQIELRGDDVVVRGQAVVVAEGVLHLPPFLEHDMDDYLQRAMSQTKDCGSPTRDRVTTIPLACRDSA
jgi:trans-2,3-dihydro-3-hydroxyanthranilate isomerase